MASDPYLQALDELAEAVHAHRAIYATSERGLLTWHIACCAGMMRISAAIKVYLSARPGPDDQLEKSASEMPT